MSELVKKLLMKYQTQDLSRAFMNVATGAVDTLENWVLGADSFSESQDFDECCAQIDNLELVYLNPFFNLSGLEDNEYSEYISQEDFDDLCEENIELI